MEGTRNHLHLTGTIYCDDDDDDGERYVKYDDDERYDGSDDVDSDNND
jgi:hypothetical protein